MNDIIHGAGHVNDIFPYFLQHAREVFPHLVCMDDLKKISDLRLPANWYPEARAIQRKIIFHAGPTNSGKTYHALQRFLTAKSGVYCGPLKLLAVEVFHKSNNEVNRLLYSLTTLGYTTFSECLQAGLHPTADQIELFAYHLPNATLSNLMVLSANLAT
ncbi:ATP-dependent RNA helicase SUV3 homolog, mitochondrial-like [Octopus sinensis]|uniref:ATP-dependent RNA helicase SUV3 homolog, mitochondrial-like n=1 Tax=Octopus sinensis TaxID=2607531 RepID=A0A7E6EVR3_9MOLL|nr:ATP-dependent RNA helicase SUV3 homolog, mitochondrial-like [Octopus sinensis]